MRRLFGALLVAATLCAADAHARASEPQAMRYPLGTLLDGVALNAAAATRTFSVSTDGTQAGYDLLVAYVDFTRGGSATNVTMTCTNKPTATDNDATLQDCSVSSGECTSSDAAWKKTLSVNGTWPWRVNIAGFPGQVDCVMAGASATASDTVTVKGWLVTQ